MLLQPLEKKLDLPTVMIEFGYHHWADIQRISEENELSLFLFVPVCNASDLLEVLASGQFSVHVTGGIG